MTHLFGLAICDFLNVVKWSRCPDFVLASLRGPAGPFLSTHSFRKVISSQLGLSFELRPHAVLGGAHFWAAPFVPYYRGQGMPYNLWTFSIRIALFVTSLRFRIAEISVSLHFPERYRQLCERFPSRSSSSTAFSHDGLYAGRTAKSSPFP